MTSSLSVGTSASSDAVLNRVRLDMGDIAMPFSFEIVGDGERRHFRIEHRPVDLSTIKLVQNRAPTSGGGTIPDTVSVTGAFTSAFSAEFQVITLHAPAYIIDVDSGVLVFATPPSPGVSYIISGSKWRYFTDEDYAQFIETSVAFNTKSLTNASGGALTMSSTPAMYEFPIALYAEIQALWALVTDAAFDIDILAPDGVNIPRSQRYRQLIELIGARTMQYDEIAAALNIGISAIEVYTVRRTAKLTNRLVPVILPAEYDDASKPKRILAPPSLLGTTPVKTHVGNYDIDLYSGYPWSMVLDFNRDLSGYNPEACIRLYEGGAYGAPLMWFNMQYLDAELGLIQMWLTADQTRKLPYNAHWEMQLRWVTDNSPDGSDSDWEPTPFLSGMIRASITEVVA